MVGLAGAAQDQYLLTCRVFGLAVLVCRGDLAKDAELLMLRHENAVPRRQAGRVRYEPADRAWLVALARLADRRDCQRRREDVNVFRHEPQYGQGLLCLGAIPQWPSSAPPQVAGDMSPTRMTRAVAGDAHLVTQPLSLDEMARARSGQPAPASGTNKANPLSDARGQRRAARPE
jgi:hypothetical protein